MRFVTYNIRHAQGEDAWISPARIARVIRTIDADVIGMNEVWRVGSHRLDQPSRLAEHLGMRSAFEPNALMGPIELGNLILAHGEITRTENLKLPHRREHRACLLADIEIDGVPVRFASTHLSLHRATRAEQLAFLAQTLPRDLPLVLAGDLNCSAKELGPLAEAFTVVELPPPTYPALWPLRTLDHIAFSAHWELESLSTVRSIASDHVPLVADLRLR